MDVDHIDTWIFDLDNTLYPPSARLFDQINGQMTGFIMRELAVSENHANALRRDLWQRYGATLTGLIREHAISAEDFLRQAHDIDLSGLVADRALARRLKALPGRRIVHTNGSRAHAANVLAARGLEGVFDQIIAIEDTDLHPKPSSEAYDAFLSLTGAAPERAAMIEDHADNLREPKIRGMVTIWVHANSTATRPEFVDHHLPCVHSFLKML